MGACGQACGARFAFARHCGKIKRMSDAQGQALADKSLLRSLPELASEAGEMLPAAPRPAKQAARKGPPPETLFKPGERRVGRVKGTPNKLTVGLREAVELAVQPGQCHPQGFAGWLVERAHGGIEDRKIFAGVVSRVIPLQVEKKSDTTMRIELGWLNGRDVGRHLSQPLPIAAQVIDITTEKQNDPVIKDQSEQAGQGGEGASEQG